MGIEVEIPKRKLVLLDDFACPIVDLVSYSCSEILQKSDAQAVDIVQRFLRERMQKVYLWGSALDTSGTVNVRGAPAIGYVVKSSALIG